MIREHQTASVGERCAYSRLSYRASCVHNVGFRAAVCVIRRPLFILGSHTTIFYLYKTHAIENYRRENVFWISNCGAVWPNGLPVDFRGDEPGQISMHISNSRT
jgi:hypothetical protein